VAGPMIVMVTGGRPDTRSVQRAGARLLRLVPEVYARVGR
jgi:hypothetical protein